MAPRGADRDAAHTHTHTHKRRPIENNDADNETPTPPLVCRNPSSFGASRPTTGVCCSFFGRIFLRYPAVRLIGSTVGRYSIVTGSFLFFVVAVLFIFYWIERVAAHVDDLIVFIRQIWMATVNSALAISFHSRLIGLHQLMLQNDDLVSSFCPISLRSK